MFNLQEGEEVMAGRCQSLVSSDTAFPVNALTALFLLLPCLCFHFPSLMKMLMFSYTYSRKAVIHHLYWDVIPWQLWVQKTTYTRTLHKLEQRDFHVDIVTNCAEFKAVPLFLRGTLLIEKQLNGISAKQVVTRKKWWSCWWKETHGTKVFSALLSQLRVWHFV